MGGQVCISMPAGSFEMGDSSDDSPAESYVLPLTGTRGGALGCFCTDR